MNDYEAGYKAGLAEGGRICEAIANKRIAHTNKQWIMALKRKGIIVTQPDQLASIWIATLGQTRKRPNLVIGDD